MDSDGNCRVEVIDTGIGIDEDQLDEIFREFHQIKAPGASNEGFGLGLAIVKRLASLLHVTIAVDSLPGKGSCFSVTIPTVASVDPAHDAESVDAHDADATVGGLIILIEDDVNVANAWGMLLEAEGFRVAMATSAKEANALIGHLDEVPALLISDFHLLDGSTGVEAVSQIREYFDAHIPAFIVSGDTSKIVKEARLLDNCTLLSKPVDTNRLLTAARRAIRSGDVPRD